MPTEFDWKSWKKRQNEPLPPPPPEPKMNFFVLTANGLFYIVVFGSLLTAYLMTSDIENSSKIAHICNEQKGVAIRTIRGDAVCIKSDVLTDVLSVKSSNRAN